MTNFNTFFQQIATNRLSHWLHSLPAQLHDWQKNNLHGEFKHWQKTIDALPVSDNNHVDLTNSVTVGKQGDFSEGEYKRLENLLKKLNHLKVIVVDALVQHVFVPKNNEFYTVSGA